jgi:pSer/pThr/pTyr-binding forkhead associated (FHA) protein
MGTLLTKFLVGAAAGLMAWAVLEPSAPKDHAQYIVSGWENTFVLVLGGLIGLGVGGFDGFARGGLVNTAKGAGLGLFFGAVGLAFGHGFVGAIVQSLFGPFAFGGDSGLLSILPRAMAFSGMGLCLGAAIGASSLNVRKIIQGAIGGFVGGVVAGVVFDPLSIMLANAMNSGGDTEVGGPGRAVTALLLGAAIALFIGIVDRLARSAWLRLSLGRNEGKEWVIDSNQTFIGSREGINVPLFGDPNIAPIHASIQRQGGAYLLVDGGSPIGTLLNGQHVGQAPLFHGAIIQIGSYALQFLMKNQAAPVATPEMQTGMAYQLQPQAIPIPGQQVAWTQMPAAASMPTMAVQPVPAAIPAGVGLVAIDGPLMGQRFPIGHAIDVGREASGIPMSFDTAASRRHASLTPAQNGVSITDLGSTNGTFVNGQRVSQAFARVGDLVKIGSTTFRIEAQ